VECPPLQFGARRSCRRIHLCDLTEHARWKAGGTYETVRGNRIFVRRTGGNGPLVVLLHGVPTNSYDWREVIPALEATGAAVLAFDFLGFGLSDKPTNIRYSLKRQADIVEALVDRQPALIVAHDMGDSVAAELMARELDNTLTFPIPGALSTNSSVIIGKANLTAVQKPLRGPLGPLVADFNS
jgi:pimeloyl-ACP methyl ester carboxylesterase